MEIETARRRAPDPRLLARVANSSTTTTRTTATSTKEAEAAKGVKAEKEEKAAAAEGDYPPGRITRRHGSRFVELRRLYGLTTQRSP